MFPNRRGDGEAARLTKTFRTSLAAQNGSIGSMILAARTGVICGKTHISRCVFSQCHSFLGRVALQTTLVIPRLNSTLFGCECVR
jgi:hypothetical protein